MKHDYEYYSVECKEANIYRLFDTKAEAVAFAKSLKFAKDKIKVCFNRGWYWDKGGE
ncbi:Uncharacterised protein [Moraxella caviae]|uniref:Uncharacterized protein n=1 Tax=Moraxella caviae TaxID=34060 RepID=A0A378R913_9GAMM|nr:hypothetical protein [Moraxella caviae]STZ13970.1 Uncharacterised protein [Moraxella caviae]VEW12990.1 Uncharacterised protein [Moraxella caviae]